jgi:2'-5' RNA ligase
VLEQNTDDYRYWLAVLLEDLPVNSPFQPEALHINIIPWFVLEANEAEMIKNFYSKFANIKSFKLKLGGIAMFGPKKDVAVNLAEATPQIMNLHTLALNWFEAIGARWAVKNPHVGSDYVPHVRRRQGTKLQQGDVVSINSLCLIRATRREDNIRSVVAKAEFYEQN